VPGVVKNRIRIVDLNRAIESEIAVPGPNILRLSTGPSTELISSHKKSGRCSLVWFNIQRDGAFQVLWAQTAGVEVWGIPSPDGRHLATFRTRLSDYVKAGHGTVNIAKNIAIVRQRGFANYAEV
jgi:hypothetical protein